MASTFRHSKKVFLMSSLFAFAFTWLGCGETTDPSTEGTRFKLAATLTTAELIAIQDSRTQAGSGDVNFGGAQLWVNTQNGHFSFVEFDMNALPADAHIESAALVLRFTGNYAGDHTVEVGRVDGSWDEGTITWNNQPVVTWGGPQRVVGDVAGDVDWDVTDVVAAWQSGGVPNEGLAIRGAGDAAGKIFHSKDSSALYPPRLVVTYSRAPDLSDAQPDLGDAPDSSNHHGIANTAYVGIPGQFPTVWNVPAGLAAGPRHANRHLEAFLGGFVSRENEADLGPDQDGPNNILRNALTGVTGDVADMDRGDDGWRNRGVRFSDCQKQTLSVRVSKTPAATLNTMYLNVWFDGTRDGDWTDTASCLPASGAPAQAGYEWIVQNEIIDLTAIAAGSYLDFVVDTERVLNATPGMPHWMRFTLSEEPAVQPAAGGLPDGRGPHPTSALGSYQFGETEDVFQLPPPPAPGELVLQKQVLEFSPAFGELGAGQTIPQGGVVRYRIQLRHQGGTAPVPASIRDLLPLPIIDLHLASPPVVTSATGGAAPLVAAGLQVENGAQRVGWEGILAPDSEVTIDFNVHVHPSCSPFQASTIITNVARADANGQQVSAEAGFRADCPGDLTIQEHDLEIDFGGLPPLQR